MSAADFTQLSVAHTQPACKQTVPGDPPYHTPHPGISVASGSFDEQYCLEPEPDIALAYSVMEPARSGRLVVDAAIALDVQPGADYHRLKSGKSVPNRSGVTVHPEQVFFPVRCSRSQKIGPVASLSYEFLSRRCLRHASLGRPCICKYSQTKGFVFCPAQRTS